MTTLFLSCSLLLLACTLCRKGAVCLVRLLSLLARCRLQGLPRHQESPFPRSVPCLRGAGPFDTFGPSRNERDELGFTPGEMVPAEIPRREIYGDLDPYAARWQAPSLGMRQRRAAELGKELRQFWEQESDDRVRSK
mmetsp:Transcript_6683/g.14598  ORF Transcript_6683/g.14598 Transcript_6683/m.14598 type:complete len:137 (-) Transcript_6683:345-755(-)